MLRVTRTIKRPTLDTSWFVIPIDPYDEYLAEFVYTGKLLSLRIFMSDDQLEMKVVQLFTDQDAFNAYTTSKPWKNIQEEYDTTHGITETDPIVETLHDTDPYLQEFMFDFSIINHPDGGDKDNEMDPSFILVEPRTGMYVETYDPKGPAW